MKMERRIIALAGLSGAGKTTLIRKVSGLRKFVHLSASELIKDYLRAQNVQKTSESLRTGDIPGNQELFVEAFKTKAATIKDHIVLDCHTVIDTPTGIQRIPAETFGMIGITEFLFLPVDPEELHARRKSDISRSRPDRTVAELAEQQKIALEVTKDVAESLSIPLTDIGLDPERYFISVLKTLP